jgi:hypothetical protein
MRREIAQARASKDAIRWQVRVQETSEGCCLIQG